jgi:tRNA uridine 5-carbamoylmethylation protein Kti12
METLNKVITRISFPRHSVMLVGMPFSGKTTALNTLQKALTDLAQEPMDVMDPQHTLW